MLVGSSVAPHRKSGLPEAPLLSGRPLFDTKEDASVFVGRKAELAALKRAIELGLNALVIGDRGIGKTSLLRRLALDLRSIGVDAAFLDGRSAVDTPSLLESIGYRLSSPGTRLAHSAAPNQPGRLEHLLDDIRAALSGPPRQLLLDDLPSAAAGLDLFGRLRDALWRLPVRWIVAVDSIHQTEFLHPPVDSFFDVRVVVDPFPGDLATLALKKRMGGFAFPDQQVEDVLAVARGNPRRLLATARDVLVDRAGGSALRRRAELHSRLALLSRSATILVEELEALGSLSASDERLLARLHWTRSRAGQVFKELHTAGVVSWTWGKRGGPGAPRRVYHLAL